MQEAQHELRNAKRDKDFLEVEQEEIRDELEGPTRAQRARFLFWLMFSSGFFAPVYVLRLRRRATSWCVQILSLKRGAKSSKHCICKSVLSFFGFAFDWLTSGARARHRSRAKSIRRRSRKNDNYKTIS